MQILVDAQARNEALDINKSFIVQAPAGSGKTHLLITRYLRSLLEIKDDIDEVLAITFTNKAALEMRNRVINLLKSAANNYEKTDLSLQEI